MNRAVLYFILFLFFGTAVTSCVADPDEVTFFNPDQEFLINLNQKLSPDGPHLVFEISTLDHFNCTEVFINSDITISDSTIDLEIKNLEIPKNCAIVSSSETNIGPLEVASDNPSAFLESPTYDFKISAEGLFLNTGTVNSEITHFNIQMNSSDGITMGRTMINKIPDHHVWGYIESQNTSIDFIEGLNSFVGNSSIISAGDYGLFNITSSDRVEIPGNEESLNTTFIYSVDDINGLREYVKNTRDNFTDVELVLTLSNGEEL